jgi:hypothetical protein
MNFNINLQNEILNFLDINDIIKLYKTNPKLIEGFTSNEFYNYSLKYKYIDEDFKVCNICGFKLYKNSKKLKRITYYFSNIYNYLYKVDSKDKSKDKYLFSRDYFMRSQKIKIIFCSSYGCHIYNIHECDCFKNNRIIKTFCDDDKCNHNVENFQILKCQVPFYDVNKDNLDKQFKRYYKLNGLDENYYKKLTLRICMQSMNSYVFRYNDEKEELKFMIIYDDKQVLQMIAYNELLQDFEQPTMI